MRFRAWLFSAPNQRVSSRRFRLRHSIARVFGSGLLASLVLICAPWSRADLIGVAFNSPNQYGLAPLISGPDPASTAANPLFGAANIWNNLNIPFGVESTNPSWSNLVNSTGAVTSANLHITGTVGGVDFYPFISGLNPLRSESVAWNDNASGGFPGISTSISWALTGLVPNATYDMCVYGSQANYNRSFNMTIEGTTLNIPTYDATTSSPTPNCVLFTNIQSDGSGVITGVGTGIGDLSLYTSEADWSGFQIVQVPDASAVPEPSSLFLLGTGSLAFLGRLVIRSCSYRWH